MATMNQVKPDRRIEAFAPMAGVRIAAIESGIGYTGRPDLLLAAFDEGTSVAGVLSTSRTAAAPLRWSRTRLDAKDAPRGLVVNAGNANCFTGTEGEQAVRETVDHAARLLGCRAEEVYVASTGKIGVQLDMAKMRAGLEAGHRDLNQTDWDAASRAILTTDRAQKVAAVPARIGETAVGLQGMTKGSMMIAPSLATTLSLLFTDAALPAPVMQAALADAADETFNMISVDNTQSTNDSILMFATGAGPKHPVIDSAGDSDFAAFRDCLRNLLSDLSQQILDDARNDGVLIRIHVSGAESKPAARQIAMTVANSYLIRRMAAQGGEFQFGRVIAAVGMAGEAVDQRQLVLRVGGEVLSRHGAFVNGAALPVAQCLDGNDLNLDIDVGVGAEEATGYAVAHHGFV